MKKLCAFGKRMLGFSLIELTITMVVIAVITAAFAPTITKRMKNASTAVVGLSTKCEQRVNANCQLCDKSGCVWCGLSRSVPNKYVDEKTCTHKNCAANCLRCSGAGALCLQCSPGYYLNSGQCLSCPAGKYCLGGNKAPTNCPKGTYQANAGAHTSCTNCVAGKYQSSEGQTSCLNCAAGTYQNAIGQASCINCNAGSYSSSVGATSCTLCPIGKYQASAGQSSCSNCAAGTYQDAIGQASCKDCPMNYKCTGGSAIEACGVGYGANGKNSACSACITGCFDCQNTTKCDYCKGGYYLNSSGKCQGCPVMNYCPANSNHSYYACPSGTFSTANSETCSACTHFDARCIACNESACTQCATNYVLNSSKACVLATCDAGKYLLGGVCTNCTAGNYCAGGTAGQVICPANKWSADIASACTKCPTDKPLSPQGSKSESACVSCTSKFGVNCTSCNYTKCLSCPTSGYYMSSATGNPACIPCINYHANCTACNTTECTACEDGYETHSSLQCNKLCENVPYYNCDGNLHPQANCKYCAYRVWKCNTSSGSSYNIGNYGCKSNRDGCWALTNSDKKTSHGNSCCKGDDCFYSSDCSTTCRFSGSSYDFKACSERKPYRCNKDGEWLGYGRSNCVATEVCE